MCCEVVDATLHLINHPDASIADLMKFVKGPDFPTGGLILGRTGINDAYKTGRGSIKMRAKVAIEEGQRNQMRIVVTELPYQASCSAIAARIQELVDGGDLDGIADVNDNSSGGETNLIITLKRDANSNVVMNNLFKLTTLQTSFPVNRSCRENQSTDVATKMVEPYAQERHRSHHHRAGDTWPSCRQLREHT